MLDVHLMRTGTLYVLVVQTGRILIVLASWESPSHTRPEAARVSSFPDVFGQRHSHERSVLPGRISCR